LAASALHSFDVSGVIYTKTVHFYITVNQFITKKMHFFFFQSVVFGLFLHYIYGTKTTRIKMTETKEQ